MNIVFHVLYITIINKNVMFCLNLSETIKDTTCFLNFVDVSLSKEINPISLVNACTGCFQTSKPNFSLK